MGIGIPLGGDKNVLELDSADVCTTVWIYSKSLNCALFKGEFYGMCISLSIEKTKNRQK